MSTPNVQQEDCEKVEVDYIKASESDSSAKSSHGNLNAVKSLPEWKKADLSLRNDVVNKTILRAIKKYYTDKLKASTQFFDTKAKGLRKKIYVSSVDELVKSEFIGKNGQEIFNSSEIETTSLYLCWIIKPEYLARKYLTYEKQKFRKIYDSCLRYYSNINYERLMRFEAFSNIFKCFVTSGNFEQMAKSDSTLSRTPELYIARANEMIQNSVYKLESSKSKVNAQGAELT